MNTLTSLQYGPERECQTGDELAYMIRFTNTDESKKFENMSRERQINFLLAYLNTCFGHLPKTLA